MLPRTRFCEGHASQIPQPEERPPPEARLEEWTDVSPSLETETLSDAPRQERVEKRESQRIVQ